jgi:hypothetical protein
MLLAIRVSTPQHNGNVSSMDSLKDLPLTSLSSPRSFMQKRQSIAAEQYQLRNTRFEYASSKNVNSRRSAVLGCLEKRCVPTSLCTKVKLQHFVRLNESSFPVLSLWKYNPLSPSRILLICFFVSFQSPNPQTMKAFKMTAWNWNSLVHAPRPGKWHTCQTSHPGPPWICHQQYIER